jgi:histidinol-phosphatase
MASLIDADRARWVVDERPVLGGGRIASPAMGTRADLDLALSCSDAAAALALRYFDVGVEASTKADGTPVTEADRAVEHLLRQMLDAEAPGDALLGEEFGRLGDSQRLWILDPVDGTFFFSRRDPNWRVHIALEVAGNTEVAVVTAPALGCQWWATRGGGAFESSWPRDGNATRLRVSRTASLAGALVDALDAESRARLPREATLAPPSPLALVELVRGEIDGFLAERYHLWDHAPWILLVEEAGGRFTDRAGRRRGDRGGGLYSNANLHTQLLKTIGYPAPA